MKRAIAFLCSAAAVAALNIAGAQDADGDTPPSACISTDSEISDSAHWALTAVNLFENKRYEEAVAAVDACFDEFEDKIDMSPLKFEERVVRPSLEDKLEVRES